MEAISNLQSRLDDFLIGASIRLKKMLTEEEGMEILQVVIIIGVAMAIVAVVVRLSGTITQQSEQQVNEFSNQLNQIKQ